jgi:hypothetical protein
VNLNRAVIWPLSNPHNCRFRPPIDDRAAHWPILRGAADKRLPKKEGLSAPGSSSGTT